VPVIGLIVYLTVLALQRGVELWHAAHNERRLAAAGAVRQGDAHYPWIVLLHVLSPVSLIVEVVGSGARPDHLWPGWLTVWLLAQALRYWAVVSLGERWTARIWVLPGSALVRRGPYRWLAHPNYVAVIAEFVAAPMMFGAWRTAVLFSALNAWALTVRIRTERRALATAAHHE
jgi:methyltransferase